MKKRRNRRKKIEKYRVSEKKKTAGTNGEGKPCQTHKEQKYQRKKER